MIPNVDVFGITEFLNVLRDSEDAKNLRVQLDHLAQLLNAHFEEERRISQVAEEMNAGLSLDVILSNVYESFREFIPYDRIGLALLDESGTQVQAHWARTSSVIPGITVGYSAPLAGSSLETIIQKRRPRILNNLLEYLKAHPHSQSTRLIVSEGMRSSLTCPLVAKGRNVGFLFFSSVNTNAYSEAHVEVYSKIANQLAIAVEKARIYEELRVSNELKERFLGIAAHDLKNPIAAVWMGVQLLMRGRLGELNAEQAKLLGTVSESCETMVGLVNEFLDYSVLKSGNVTLRNEEIDPKVLLEQTLHNFELQAQHKGIALTLQTGAPLPSLLVDREKTLVVLQNLVANAIKYSSKGGTVKLEASVEQDAVVVSVTDNGPGIIEEDLPKLFKEFGVTRNRPTAGEKSTGLGLYIAKKYIEAQRGWIGVETRTGEGSKFRFGLPLRPKKSG